MQLASQGWAVTALDNSSRRMERLASNLERTQLKAEMVKADISKWESEPKFDAILLDAPCSATGTMRRHPDVLHRIGMKQINELAALQSAMLDRAASWLKPGGKLVYATCSLEPHEGEAQIPAFLERHSGLEIDPVTSAELPEGLRPIRRVACEQHTPVLADEGGLDGFFIARLAKP